MTDKKRPVFGDLEQINKIKREGVINELIEKHREDGSQPVEVLEDEIIVYVVRCPNDGCDYEEESEDYMDEAFENLTVEVEGEFYCAKCGTKLCK